ncbi:hypothetical protein ACFWIQ_30050 [Kitasatospora sp. NPDC127059]|uniref:hypothetical protein n=1 Tax=unclassified Kitasatospora TaxID=2633591 RepID=UPI0036690503
MEPGEEGHVHGVIGRTRTFRRQPVQEFLELGQRPDRPGRFEPQREVREQTGRG